MPVFETFAKRMRTRAMSGKAEVYQYKSIPTLLRKQISLVLTATLGDGVSPSSDKCWSDLARIMEKETLEFPGQIDYPKDRCLEFLSKATDVNEWISLVELACKLMIGMSDAGSEFSRIHCNAHQLANDALDEINVRFRENSFGYQHENGEFIRIDEQYVHAEIIKPALQLLSQKGFGKANEDFMTAHRHYRSGEIKDAIVAAARAFESTLKAVCDTKQISYAKGARATELISAVKHGKLFPEYLDEGLNTYIAMLKTGVPGVRNNAGGHGSAPNSPSVQSYFASYALHLTAANIIFLVSAMEE